MPIKAVITVNENHITTIQVARVKGNGMKPGDMNVYAVVETDEPTWKVDWDNAPKFEHVYGQGVAVCVAKAIDVLEIEKD